jgi:hypothetical protein
MQATTLQYFSRRSIAVFSWHTSRPLKFLGSAIYTNSSKAYFFPIISPSHVSYFRTRHPIGQPNASHTHAIFDKSFHFLRKGSPTTYLYIYIEFQNIVTEFS